MTKININENYFETIDTSNKAWSLGFVAADGSIFANRNSIQLEVTQKISDRDVIDKLKKEWESNHEIKIKKYNEKLYVKLNIYRPKMCQDLINLGIGKDKSINLKMPKISKKLISHFIRGYFCGNGWWSIHKNTMEFGITGPVLEFITEIRDFLATECELNPNVGIYTNQGVKKGSCWRVQYCGNNQCEKIANLLYNDADLYLERKFQFQKNHFENVKYKL